jgi:hypothetical protein
MIEIKTPVSQIPDLSCKVHITVSVLDEFDPDEWLELMLENSTRSSTVSSVAGRDVVVTVRGCGRYRLVNAFPVSSSRADSRFLVKLAYDFAEKLA